MDELESRLLKAKENVHELEKLLVDYLPFIKRIISDSNIWSVEYDDALSISMLTFVNCIKQYEVGKGAFLPFCSVCIRNRLLDEIRKQSRHFTQTTMPPMPDEEETIRYMERFSVEQYNKDMEKLDLSEEIIGLSTVLQEFDIDYWQLVKICPKQKRSRIQCYKVADTMVKNEKIRKSFLKTHKIPITELARECHISSKTIEKHRKYIVTVAIIILGDYPNIRTFLPM